MEIAKF